MLGRQPKPNLPTPIFRRILAELKLRSLPVSDLQEYMYENGMDLPVTMVDEWAEYDDLRVIARYFPIPPSDLIVLKGDSRWTAIAYLDELWPKFEDSMRISRISKAEAWKAIELRSEFRGGHPEAIKREVELILDALSRPGRQVNCTTYLDCTRGCRTQCEITGHMLED